MKCLCPFIVFKGRTSKTYKDEVNVAVRDDGSRYRRSSDGITIPARSLEVSFSVRRNSVTLRLSRNDDLTPEVPVYTANVDGVIKEDIEKAFYYQDVSKGAAVFVQTTQSSSYCLFGSFFMEDGEFFMEPSQRACTDLQVNSTFRIWRSNISEIQDFDFIDGEIVEDYEPILGKEKVRFKRNVADLKIETLFIIDYSIYSYWYSRVTVKKESDRPRNTRRVIRQFYAFVINGMDVRFKNIPPKSSGFTLSVVFSGIFIADTETSSPFTEDNKVASNQVDADMVLNHTTTWVQEQKGLPGFDHAMMFSRYDIVRKTYSSIIGYAWKGTICTPKSVSIVEDRFSFTILSVAAHELGHSLNASHDGYGNQCSSDDHYIMARYSDVRKGLLNPWNFSTCSIHYFRDLIDSLDDKGLNCMANLRDDFDSKTLIKKINKLPGTVYDVDEQCGHIVGEGSRLCREPYNNNFTNICTILYCSNTYGGGCDKYLGGDGLSCGNKRWCLSGVCTFSESAPTKNERCMFGDDPRSFQVRYYQPYGYFGYYGIYRYRTLHCKDGYYSVKNFPSLCKSINIRLRCCDTCSPYYSGFLGTAGKTTRIKDLPVTKYTSAITTMKTTMKTTTKTTMITTTKITFPTTVSIPTVTSLPTTTASTPTITSLATTTASTPTVTSLPTTTASTPIVTSLPTTTVISLPTTTASTPTVTSLPTTTVSTPTVTSLPTTTASTPTVTSLPTTTASTPTVTSFPTTTVSTPTVTSFPTATASNATSHLPITTVSTLISNKTDPIVVYKSCGSDQSCGPPSTESSTDKEDISIIIIISVAGGAALTITCAITLLGMICARKKKPKEQCQYIPVPLQVKIPV